MQNQLRAVFNLKFIFLDKSMKNKRREEGEEIRLKALERLGETGQRKKDKEDRKGPKKSRRSGGDTIQYLREKSEQEMKLREKDQELEKSKQEEEKRNLFTVGNSHYQPIESNNIVIFHIQVQSNFCIEMNFK